MNQELKTISQVYYTMQDILSVARRRDWVRESLFNVTQRLTGMPRSGGLPQGIDSGLARLDEMERAYTDALLGGVEELSEAQRILDSIGRMELRVFVQMLYLDGFSGAEVRRELGLSKWKFDKIRQNVESAERLSEAKWPEEESKTSIETDGAG